MDSHKTFENFPELSRTLQNSSGAAIQSIRDLYCSREDSDVSLVCEGGVIVKAHKFVLCFHSEVFRSVLGDLREQHCHVSLPGTYSEDLDFLLNMMYFRPSSESHRDDNKLHDLIRRLNFDNLVHSNPRQEVSLSEAATTVVQIKEEILAELVTNEGEQLALENSSQIGNDVVSPLAINCKDQDMNDEVEIRNEVTSLNFCNKCQMTFQSAAHLEEHYKTNSHQEKAVRCDLCGKKFRTEMMRKIHREEHLQQVAVDEDGRFVCNKCDKTFKDLYRLRSHKIIHVQGMFSCDQCDSKFSNYHGLKYHLGHHDTYVECDQCDKRYRGKFMLREHKLTVHEGLKLKCNFCEKTFSGASNLAKHVKAEHIGMRFNCDQCNYSAKKRPHLKAHIEAAHPTAASVLHQCLLCQYKSYSMDKVKKHQYSCKNRTSKKLS